MSELTAQEIERRLEQDRAELAQSISRLREALAPSALVDQGRAALAGQLEPLAARLDAAVRRKPVAAAIAGVALAALVFGRDRNRPDEAPEDPPLAGTRYEALSRWEDEGGPALAPLDDEEEWLVEAQALHSRAGILLQTIDDAARRGLAPAAELARHRAAVLRALARDTQKALGRGLEALSEAAREQRLLARERIYISRLSLGAGTEDLVKRYPLATGSVLAAVGGALAFLFPQTESEDRIMGDARDELIRSAKGAARAEVAKASALARALYRALGQDVDAIGSVFRPAGRRDVRGHAHTRH